MNKKCCSYLVNIGITLYSKNLVLLDLKAISRSKEDNNFVVKYY